MTLSALEGKNMDYSEFLKSKMLDHKPSGFEIGMDKLNRMLFDWQKVLVRWSLFKGRAALFEDCGLGKTPQQLEWAHQIFKKTDSDVLRERNVWLVRRCNV